MIPLEMLLPKTGLSGWIWKLLSREIYAPVLEGGVWNYGKIDDPQELLLAFPQTVQSPKKIIFPQREVLLDFKTAADGAAAARGRLPEVGATVVFGVRPCDARALLLTDRVFLGADRDPYYGRRRAATALVGLACTPPPSPNCFCPSVGGAPCSTTGLDLLMTDLGELYTVEALTDRGRELLLAGEELFRPATDETRKRRAAAAAAAETLIRRRIGALADVPGRLRGMFDSPIWARFSAPCIRCGICTYLCPTCHCFDISDEIRASEPPSGERVRTWDTCQFPDFTMHSSGHNPRPDQAARQRQRILHKFLYFPDTQGDYQCTGCGRCSSLCPVGIDLIDILNEVLLHGT